MTRPAATRVLRRKVFYIPGYDPYPPRRYRELYRREGTEQAKISGYDLSIRQRVGSANYGWHISGHMDGHRVESEVEVLAWSDLVKTSMDRGIWATYLLLFKTVWIYLSTGVLRRLMLLRKGPVLAAVYPVAMLLGQGVAALLLAWLVGALFSALTLPKLGWVAGIPVFVLILRWFAANDSRFYAYYLMHDFAFSAGLYGKNPPELDARLAEFRNRIEAAMESDVDEVLVVGHSSGAHLGVHVLADLIRTTPAQDRPALGFLTLGQVVPMVSFLPNATRLRADLHDLSLSNRLCWVDVSAPGDGCSFALCDPVAVSGVAAPQKRWPLVFSAAFTQTLSPEKQDQLKRRYFRLHFQYLCAFDRPNDYDYFQITAGPMTLADRYRHRKPSNNRIDVQVSDYTSMVDETGLGPRRRRVRA